MEKITVCKNNNKIEFALDITNFLYVISSCEDCVNQDDSKLYVYYNLANNILYAGTPKNLEKYMGWSANQPVSIINWVKSFTDGRTNCVVNYLHWLNQNLSTYSILYGIHDIVGDLSKPGHIIRDMRFAGTFSICIAIYKKNLPLIGFIPRVINDLANTLQSNEHITIKEDKLWFI